MNDGELKFPMVSWDFETEWNHRIRVMVSWDFEIEWDHGKKWMASWD